VQLERLLKERRTMDDETEFGLGRLPIKLQEAFDAN
jgi:hypothetical protein